MARYFSLALYLSLFVVLFAALCIQQNENTAQEIRKVDFCDLAQRPEHFDQQTLCIQAILTQSRGPLVDGGEPFIYDRSCNSQDKWVLIEYSSSYKPNTDLADSLSKIISQSSNRGVGRARVEIVERFELAKRGGFGHLDGFRSRFIITSLEGANSVSPSVPWPKNAPR